MNENMKDDFDKEVVGTIKISLDTIIKIRIILKYLGCYFLYFSV